MSAQNWSYVASIQMHMHAHVCNCLFIYKAHHNEQQHDTCKHVGGATCMRDCIARLEMTRMHAVSVLH